MASWPSVFPRTTSSTFTASLRERGLRGTLCVTVTKRTINNVTVYVNSFIVYGAKMPRQRRKDAGSYVEMGRRFEEVRKKAGFSQAKFGGALGVTGSAIGMIERGMARPSVQLLQALHDKFGVAPDDIMGIAAPPPPMPRDMEMRSVVSARLVAEQLRKDLSPEKLDHLASAVVLYDVLVDGEVVTEEMVRRTIEQLKATRTPPRLQDQFKGLSDASRDHIKGMIRLLAEKEAPALPVVPLFRIAAGKGLEAVDGDEHIEVPIHHAQKALTPGSYALLVVGDSMTGGQDNILDGDVILVTPDPDPPEGSRAVLRRRSTNQVTLKRFYRRGKRVELRPSNPEFKTEHWPADDTEIQGVYAGLIRSSKKRPK